jgi:release factor glutamine methyltransferase
MPLPSRLNELYKQLRQRLQSAGVQTADRDARIIIHNHTGLEWTDIIAGADQRILSEQLQAIANDADRRIAGEPVSRIYGERGFWGLDFKICPDTLDPRPDTETLIEEALETFRDSPPRTILDLGTGSGCILISLLTEWKDAEGVGIDRSINALKTAQENARDNNVVARAHFYCGSWGLAVGASFDLIVSNPPYIPNPVIPTLSKEVRNHDPILALDGGPDGLQAYREIFTEIPRLLKPSGKALFEIGYDQESGVTRLVGESGLSLKSVHHDLSGLARVVKITRGDK